MLRIILAEDHALVRAGIRALLERIPNVEVVGEAPNGKEALELIGRTSPDIAMLDLEMPELDGLEATKLLAKEFPDVKVIILSMHRIPEFVTDAFRAGADGYVVKDADESELAAAIHTVANGESYLSPAVFRTLIVRADQPKPVEKLTARQRQVLRLLVEGQTMKEIALTLGVSIKTVEAHRAQLMDRLKIHDVPGLVRYAMRTGLTPPVPPSEDQSHDSGRLFDQRWPKGFP